MTQLAATPGAQPRVLGKTEVIHNTLSPQWTTVFKLDYELGTPVKVAVSIFDEETKRSNKPMGSAVFDVGELLGARGNTKAKRLKRGTLVAHVRKSAGSGVLRFKLKGTKLKNVEGLLSKSDPFFEVSRQINSAGGSTWDNVYRSKVRGSVISSGVCGCGTSISQVPHIPSACLFPLDLCCNSRFTTISIPSGKKLPWNCLHCAVATLTCPYWSQWLTLKAVANTHPWDNSKQLSMDWSGPPHLDRTLP